MLWILVYIYYFSITFCCHTVSSLSSLVWFNMLTSPHVSLSSKQVTSVYPYLCYILNYGMAISIGVLVGRNMSKWRNLIVFSHAVSILNSADTSECFLYIYEVPDLTLCNRMNIIPQAFRVNPFSSEAFLEFTISYLNIWCSSPLDLFIERK
jgi:hypothetical protein